MSENNKVPRNIYMVRGHGIATVVLDKRCVGAAIDEYIKEYGGVREGFTTEELTVYTKADRDSFIERGAKHVAHKMITVGEIPPMLAKTVSREVVTDILDAVLFNGKPVDEEEEELFTDAPPRVTKVTPQSPVKKMLAQMNEVDAAKLSEAFLETFKKPL